MAKSKKSTKPNTELPVNVKVQEEAPKVAANTAIWEKLLLPVLVVYAGLIFFGVIHHESWADEAQSWMVTRDNSLVSLFQHLPREGHPPLWYLVLFPFAKAGLPYEIVKIVAACITFAGVYLLMFRTKLPVVLRLLLPFSYMLLYEFSIFGRNYCLVILLLAAIISIYQKRFDKPWLFALLVVGLYNSHVLIITFCMGLTALYLVDAIQYKRLNGQTIGAFILMFAGPLYLVFLTKAEIANHFGQFITDHASKMATAVTGGMLVDGNKFLAFLLFLALLVLLVQRTKALFLALCGVAGVFYILAYKYGGTTRHFAILLVVLISSYAIAEHYKEDAFNLFKNVKQNLVKYGIYLLCGVIVLQLPATIKGYSTDINELYSDSKNAGEYIASNFDKNSIIVGWQGTSCLSVMPYLPGRKLYFAECERYGTYYVYDSAFMKENWMNPVDYAVKIAHDNFKDSLDRLVFLFNYPIMPQTEKYLDLKYQSSEPTVKWDETFYVYKFKENVK